MQLNCIERIMAIALLALYKEGNFITFRSIEALRLKLFVNEDEVKAFGLVMTDDEYRWNDRGNAPVEIEMTEMEQKLISDKLKELDELSKLTPQLVPLYEKFVVEKSLL